MSAPVRRRAASSAVQRVLVVVLLALTGLVAVTAAEPSAPAVAMSVAPPIEAAPGGEAAVSADADRSQAHDAIAMLCLCALVVAGGLLVARQGAPHHWLRRRAQRAARPPRLVCVSSLLTSADPLSWGVCRI